MENNVSMEELLNESSESVKVGTIVEGTVVQIEERQIYVDINQPTEGIIYLNYFTTDKNVTSFKDLVKVGDTVKAKVTKVEETKDGSIILLSCLDLLREKVYQELADKLAKGETIDVVAKVVKINEKSYELNYNGARVFISIKDVKDALKVGDTINVRITEVSLEKRLCFASHYLIVKEENERKHAEYVALKEKEHKEWEEAREAEIASLPVGTVKEGTVSKILPYGVIVKFDKAQGLIKMRDLDHKFVKDPSTIVSVGDKVTVKVVKNENSKIELSRKDLIESPYQTYVKNHHVSDTVKGKVISKLPFGMLIELDKDVTGLLHKSEFSWNPNDNLMASTLIGDELECAIIKTDDAEEKISLSIKALIDNPWSRVEAKVGDETVCKVTEVSSKGLKVEAFGVDGFIPARSVVLEGKSSKIEDYYNAGDEVKAIVTEINPRKWVLVLDQKAYKYKQERLEFDKYMSNEEDTVKSTTIGDLLKKELNK